MSVNRIAVYISDDVSIGEGLYNITVSSSQVGGLKHSAGPLDADGRITVTIPPALVFALLTQNLF